MTSPDQQPIEKLKHFLLGEHAGFPGRFVGVALVVFVFGLAAHAYCYFNVLYSHDSLYSVVRGGLGGMGFGRFLQGPYLAVRGLVTAPWLIGFLSLFFLSIAVYLVLAMFECKRVVPAALVAGLMTTNIVVTCTNATYLHETDIYMLSLVLAVLAAQFTMKNGWLHKLFGAVFLVASMGLYQAYLNVTVVLILALLVKDIIDGKSVKECVIKGLLALGTLAVAFILYYLCMRIALALTGVQASSAYNGVASLGDFSGTSPVGLVLSAWLYTLSFLSNPEGAHSRFQAISYGLLFIVGVGLFAGVARRKQLGAGQVLLAVGLVLLMPLAANAAFVPSKGVVHTLMIYGIFLYCPLVLVLSDCALSVLAGEGKSVSGKRPTAPSEAAVQPRVRLQLPLFAAALAWLLCAALLFFNIVGANQTYLLKQLQFESTESLMTRVLDRIEETEGYQVGETPVLFVGSPMNTPLMEQRAGFENVGGVGFFGESSITYDVKPWIHKLLGYSMKTILPSDAKGAVSLSDIASVGVFPEDDSCVFVNDVLVVKLSDVIDDETASALAE